ncbi:MAG: N-formylglutamate amidohydrolase [Xanthobacteraceae bacterium]
MTTPERFAPPPFEIAEPRRWRAPVIFNSPHSGAAYPPDFLTATRLPLATLRRSEDSFVDEMIAGLAASGFPVVRVNFPRSYVDVNREPYELDPRMFASRLPSFANTRSMRVAGGLGTIPRIAGDGQDIYRERLDVEDALGRIEALYKPYHRALRRLLDKALSQFGAAVLIDCHSMPSVGLTREEAPRPDIVIGDRYGISCAAEVTRTVEATLAGRTHSVIRNKPYAGGYITEHYGNPLHGVHAVQIEVNRAIYMDEETRARKPGLARLTADFAVLADALAALPFGDLGTFATAAE